LWIGFTYTDPNGNGHGNCHSHGHNNANAKAQSDCQRASHTAAASYSCASPVRPEATRSFLRGTREAIREFPKSQ
jgi:hypothetical protein